MDDVFKDSPLKVVSVKEDGEFEITEDCIYFLSALKNCKVS